MDLNSPELNEAEPPETDGLVAEGTLEAGGETDSSQDMDHTESPIEETGTSKTECSSTLAAPRRFASHYPARARQAPIRYDPTNSQTFHVMVC